MTREEKALICAALAWDKARKERQAAEIRWFDACTKRTALAADRAEIAEFEARDRLLVAARRLAEAKAKESP